MKIICYKATTLLSMLFIWNCNTKAADEQIIFYNKNCLNKISLFLFCFMPESGVLMRSLSGSKSADNDKVVIMIHYQNYRPIRIKGVYANDTTIMIPFYIEGKRYTHIDFKYFKDSINVQMYYYHLPVAFKFATFYYTSRLTYCLDNKERIRTIVLYSNTGYVIANISVAYKDKSRRSVLFLSPNGKPLYDESQCYCKKEYILNKEKKVIEVSHFNENDDVVLNNNGVAIYRYNYDKNGMLLQESYYDQKDRPTCGSWGYSVVKYKYDSLGNEIERAYFDNEKLVCLKNEKYAIIRKKWDNKKLIEEAYFDDKKMLVTGHAITKYDYDSKDKLRRECYLDSNGNPVCGGWYKVASITYEYPNDTTQVLRFYNARGHLTLCKEGNAGQINIYDRFGNMIRQVLFDTTEKPINITRNFASITMFYDKNNSNIEQMYYKANGTCIAHYKFSYDSLGNLVKTSFYDYTTKSGYMDFYLYDNNRNCIEYYRKYHDGRYVSYNYNGVENTAVIRYEYNFYGAVSKIIYIDSSGISIAKQIVK
ncbi:MAG: hypothetical protein ABIL66_08900 [candidate division WOR-3 bacterium]